MGNPLLKVEKLSVSYDDKLVIRNLSFSINKGENLVILGKSGVGKTTLMKAIAGLLPHASGKILYNDTPVKDAHQQLIPGHDFIKLINQDFGLDKYHTIKENIRLKLLAYTEEYRQERVTKLLRLTGLTKYADKKAIDLSGGQKQRLAFARALADEPEFILMDEPFNQLDFPTKERMVRHLKSYLKKEGISVILVTHNGDEALEWGDRLIYMENGSIKLDSTPIDFYKNPKNKKEALFFGAVNKIQLNEEAVYFRPGDISLKPSTIHTIKVNFSILQQEFRGWYTYYLTEINGKKVDLKSSEDLSSQDFIYLSKLNF